MDPEELGELLRGINYDMDKTEFLVEGFREGFKIGHKGSTPPGYPRNHKVVSKKPWVVAYKLNKDLVKCRIAGPFETPPLGDFVLNPLGLVPKTTEDGRDLPSIALDNPSSYRMITDMRKSKVNEGIPSNLTKVQYTKFDQVIERCISLGVGAYLSKTYIASAYHNVPVHLSDWHLLGFQFQGSFFFDKCLPFGLATSCRIFEEISTAIEAIVHARLHRNEYLDHYLDDFIGSAGGEPQIMF